MKESIATLPRSEERGDPDDEKRRDAASLCSQARNLWLRDATKLEDLDRVEDLYRRALNSKRCVQVATSPKGKKRKRSTTKKTVAELSPEEYRKAGERLSLLYIQSGRPFKATAGLRYLGFQCRLSERVLNYPLAPPKTEPKKSKQNRKEPISTENPPCCVVNDFLSPIEYDHLRKVFGDVSSTYWSSHNYIIDKEPPAPYFSYVIDLRQQRKGSHQDKRKGFLRKLIDKILWCSPVSDRFPNLRKDARYVELWAHNRPHASGHQLHFDSDDEGRSRQDQFPKHPIVSTVLNLSSHAQVGGPTLVTNQRLRNPTTTNLKSVNGWLVPSRPSRLVCFDGSVLHGVIPGKGTIPSSVEGDEENNVDFAKQKSEHRPRRVTLMMAFWKDIQVRHDSSPGSARPWPSISPMPEWAVELNRTDLSTSHKRPGEWKDDTNESIIPVSRVYELLDGNPVPKYHGDDDLSNGPFMPEYDRVFQGF